MYATYVAPIAFEVLIVVLTIIKASENAAALRSGPDTPIVTSVLFVLQGHYLTLTDSYSP